MHAKEEHTSQPCVSFCIVAQYAYTYVHCDTITYRFIFKTGIIYVECFHAYYPMFTSSVIYNGVGDSWVMVTTSVVCLLFMKSSPLICKPVTVLDILFKKKNHLLSVKSFKLI